MAKTNVESGQMARRSEDEKPTKKAVKVHVAEVVRHGNSIQIPSGMKLEDVVGVLQRRMQFEEEPVNIIEDIDTFIWDGVHAFAMAMANRYGWVGAEATPGFFGPQPPALIAVETGVGETVNVPWGQFSVPGIEGRLQTSYAVKEGKIIFRLIGKVKRKHEDEIKALANDTKEYLKHNSLYKGKAIKIRFCNDDGERLEMPEPKFLDLSGVDENNLVYPAEVAAAIETNLFTPVTHREECKKYGVPFKRGVLLAGKYGTGKTLAAFVCAKKAVEHGVSYIYCENINDFQSVVRFAVQYSPAVVFCEDIDRVVSGERSVNMDHILNTIDGIESKSTEVMVVLTTNNVDRIHQAMIRPGRLDAVIEVKEPDVEAVQKLVRMYGRGLVPESEDLTRVGHLLNGNIPAVIREVVERAKLSAIPRAVGGRLTILASDLELSASTMRTQLDLLNKKPSLPPSQLAELGNAIGGKIAHGMQWAARESQREVKTLNKDNVEAHPS